VHTPPRPQVCGTLKPTNLGTLRQADGAEGLEDKK